MSSITALRTLLLAFELFAGSSALMALAWLGATQKSSSARHLLWVGAFGAALLLPLLAAILPAPLHIAISAPAAALPSLHASTAAASALTGPIAEEFAFDASSVALGLAALWLTGACGLALRSLVGLICLAALRRQSRPFALAPADLPRVSATRRECELRLSCSENGPVTFGLWKPVILLPQSA